MRIRLCRYVEWRRTATPHYPAPCPDAEIVRGCGRGAVVERTAHG